MGASKLSKKLEILNDNLKIIITPDQNMLSKKRKSSKNVGCIDHVQDFLSKLLLPSTEFKRKDAHQILLVQSFHYGISNQGHSLFPSYC